MERLQILLGLSLVLVVVPIGCLPAPCPDGYLRDNNGNCVEVGDDDDDDAGDDDDDDADDDTGDDDSVGDDDTGDDDTGDDDTGDDDTGDDDDSGPETGTSSDFAAHCSRIESHDVWSTWWWDDPDSVALHNTPDFGESRMLVLFSGEQYDSYIPDGVTITDAVFSAYIDSVGGDCEIRFEYALCNSVPTDLDGISWDSISDYCNGYSQYGENSVSSLDWFEWDAHYFVQAFNNYQDVLFSLRNLTADGHNCNAWCKADIAHQPKLEFHWTE